MPAQNHSRQLLAVLLLTALAVLLASCSQPPPPPEPELNIPPVGTVGLNRAPLAPDDLQLLDIGVLVFANPPNEQDGLKFGEWVFTEVRENETYYLAFALRNTLIDSNQWGAIRVLPQQDPSVDLLISGTILQSDGSELAVEVQVSDSTGRQWLHKTYADIAFEPDYPASTRFTAGNRFDAAEFVDPFQDIYNQIANDLVSARAALSETELVTIAAVSQMVYANDLAPDSFADTLTTGEDGLLALIGLPAADDPMIARVADMRLRHHLFIDTVDDYYQELYEDMQPSYVIWRRYSFDQILEDEAARNREYDIDSYGTSRNYLTLTQRYDRFRWSKIYEQEFRELASGFNREVAPAILELNEQVHGLSGTMEEQYSQWRNILRSLFALETGQEVEQNQDSAPTGRQ